MSRRGIALLVLCLCCAALCSLYRNATIDDAYIGYRFAWSLVHGNGLVFNAGQYVEGFTHLLWVLCAAVTMALGVVDPHAVMQIIGIACSCGTAVFLYLLGERILGRYGAAWAWVPPLLAMTRANFGYYTCSGMETPMYLLLLTMGLYYLWRDGLTIRLGVVMALAELCRPETPYVFALFVALAWLRGRTGGPALSVAGTLRAGLTFGALVGGHELFRLLYYGEFLPNTYYAKSMPLAAAWPAGWAYSVDYMNHVFWIPAVALLLILLRREPRLLALVALWLLSLFPIFQFGGDWMFLYRFFAHALPFEALVVAGGLWCAADLMKKLVRPAVARTAAVALLLLLNLAGSWPRLHTVNDSYPEFYRRCREIAALIHDQPSVQRVATVDIGVLGFVSEKRIVDLGGLTDRTIARSPGGLLQKRYDPTYVLDRRPELVVLRSNGPGLVKTERGVVLAPAQLPVSDRRLFEHPDFARHYVYVFSAAVGVEHPAGAAPVTHYAYHVYRRRDVELRPFSPRAAESGR